MAEIIYIKISEIKNNNICGIYELWRKETDKINLINLNLLD